MILFYKLSITLIKQLEKKIPDVSNLVTKAKLTELENNIPDISSLAAKTALTQQKIKYLVVVVQLKKTTDYDTKITEIEKKLTDHNHDKYITAPEFNTMAASVFNARLAQAKSVFVIKTNLLAKTDFDAKLSSLNRKITVNKSKQLIVENELKKLKAFHSSYFIGKSHFDEDGTQNDVIFQPLNKYFKVIANADYVSS